MNTPEVKTLSTRLCDLEVTPGDLGGGLIPLLDAVEIAREFDKLMGQRVHMLGVVTEQLKMRAASPNTRAIAALEKIRDWKLPPSHCLSGGEPISYESAWGSEGAKNFIRGVAEVALRAIEDQAGAEPVQAEQYLVDQKPGQALTMLRTGGPGEVTEEIGTWYSPNAVRQILAAVQAAPAVALEPAQIGEEGWTHCEQTGVPGSCLMAQVFDPEGRSALIVEPTEDPKAATRITQLCAQALEATAPAMPQEAAISQARAQGYADGKAYVLDGGFNPKQEDWRDTIQGAIDELPYAHPLIPRLTLLLAPPPASEQVALSDEQIDALITNTFRKDQIMGGAFAGFFAASRQKLTEFVKTILATAKDS